MALVPGTQNTYEVFDNLHPHKRRQKIRCQILLTWKQYAQGGNPTTEMVLVDEKGTRLHATADEDVIEKNVDLLKSGTTISINGFMPSKNSGTYRTSSLPIKIALMRTSDIKLIDDFPNPDLDVYFADFADIRSGELEKENLIDVIGLVVNITPISEVKTKGKNTVTKRCELTLHDETNEQLVCTLWGPYATHAIECYEKNKRDRMICVIRFVQINVYRGKVQGVQNVYNCTQLDFNPTSDYAKAFISSLPDESAIVTHFDNTQLSIGSSLNLAEEFGERYQRKTIRELQDSADSGSFVVCGTMLEVENVGQWWYWSCVKCRFKVQEYPDDVDQTVSKRRFNCRTCKDVYDVEAKYYLVMRITDKSGCEAKVLFWNTHAKKFLKMGADELAVKFKEEFDDDPGYIPQIVEDTYDKKYLLRLHADKASKKTYTVEMFWDDEEQVQIFESQLLSEGPMLLTYGSTSEQDNSQSSSLTPISKRIEPMLASPSLEDRSSAITKKAKIKEESKK